MIARFHVRALAEIPDTRVVALVDSIEASSRKLAEELKNQATPYAELKKAIDAGKFGRLTLGETTCKWWRSQQYYDQGGWRGTKALDGGGALMNQAIHNVDLLQWMMGPVQEIFGFTATLAHQRIEV